MGVKRNLTEEDIKEVQEYLEREEIAGHAREEAYAEYERHLKEYLINCNGLGRKSLELVLDCIKKTNYKVHGKDENGNDICTVPVEG